jgi:tight adherence protein B
MQLLILALVFLAIVGLFVGGYLFVNRRSLSASEAAMDRLRDIDRTPSAAARSILRGENVSEVPLLDRLLTGRAITDVVQKQLLNAGMQMTPGSFILRVGLASMAGFVLFRLMTSAIATPLIGAIIGAGLPILWLRRKVAKRLRMFQEQLPDAIDMMVSSMKAGYSFQAAMKFIGEEIPDPLGPEFARFYEEQRLGMEVRTAMLALQDRTESLDLKMFVTAILIQRETGGNLGEVLEKISGLMRERAAIKGEIETLTAESKLSARILGALPFVVFGAVNLLNPGFMRPLLQTGWGPWLLFAAMCSVMLGYWVMMRIATIDI